VAAIAPPVAIEHPGQATAVAAGRGGGGPFRNALDRIYPYAYIAPSILFMIVASFFPIVFTVVLSLTNYGQGHVLSFSWVGLNNYVNVFSNNAELGISDFAHILLWTVIFASVTTALSFSGGLFLANLLNNENMRERNLYRTILIVPWALPGAIATLGWAEGILNQPFGLLHVVLADLGLSNGLQPQFLLDPFWARGALFIVCFWFGYPFMMTACLGALQSISPEVLQAAEIDGANVFQKFFRVTLPLLRSATLPLIISTFAFNLNNFGAVYLLTGGGPPTSNPFYGFTDTLPTAVYTLAYEHRLYFLACTYGVVIFFIIGGFSAINMKLSGAFEEVNR